VWNDRAVLPAQTVRAIFENAIISLIPKLLLPIAMAAHDRRSIPTS
jgi:hypothetical protein